MLRALTEAFSRGQRALACIHALVSKKLVGSPVTTEAQRPGKRLARLRVSSQEVFFVCSVSLSRLRAIRSSHQGVIERSQIKLGEAGSWMRDAGLQRLRP